MTSSLYGPYRLGYTCATMVITKKLYNKVIWSKSLKITVFGLKTAICLYEVGITSNRRSASYGEFVP